MYVHQCRGDCLLGQTIIHSPLPIPCRMESIIELNCYWSIVALNVWGVTFSHRSGIGGKKYLSWETFPKSKDCINDYPKNNQKKIAISNVEWNVLIYIYIEHMNIMRFFSCVMTTIDMIALNRGPTRKRNLCFFTEISMFRKWLWKSNS